MNGGDLLIHCKAGGRGRDLHFGKQGTTCICHGGTYVGWIERCLSPTQCLRQWRQKSIGGNWGWRDVNVQKNKQISTKKKNTVPWDRMVGGGFHEEFRLQVGSEDSESARHREGRAAFWDEGWSHVHALGWEEPDRLEKVSKTEQNNNNRIDMTTPL